MIFKEYAAYYDVFYKRKNYHRECDFIEALFTKYATQKPKTILDLGCGTGGHLIPLAQRGYHVEGIDRSSEMLRIAKDKCRRLNLKIKFYHRTLDKFQFKKKFDSVISIFSVIDYLTRPAEIRAAFENIAKHMKRDALFIFDFWNGKAVERFYSPRKEKRFVEGHQIIERCSFTKIFPRRNLCQVEYICKIKQNGGGVEFLKEKHTVRYFSISEMSKRLLAAGLRVIAIHPFCNIRGPIRPSTWDVTMVCQKISEP